MTDNWKSWSSPSGTAVKSTADQFHHALRDGFTVEEFQLHEERPLISEADQSDRGF